MSDRPTPETDALADVAWDGASDDYAAYAKMLRHARNLERQRDEMLDELETIVTLAVNVPDQVLGYILASDSPVRAAIAKAKGGAE